MFCFVKNLQYIIKHQLKVLSALLLENALTDDSFSIRSQDEKIQCGSSRFLRKTIFWLPSTFWRCFPKGCEPSALVFCGLTSR